MKATVGNYRVFALAGVLLAFLLASGGCRESGQLTLRFSHSLHAEENGMACDDCHNRRGNGAFSLPGHEVCSDCHEELIETAERSMATCGVCHRIKDLERIGETAAPAMVSRGIFVHAEALAGECRKCHEDIFSKKAGAGYMLSRDDVLRIRAYAHAEWKAGPCGLCHVGMDRETLPANHQADWTRRHGLSAADPDSTCSICHPQNTCRECHQAEKPASHNLLWTEKTHGLEGAWDRQRCQTCHREDFCIGCHQDTMPRSHTAAWTGSQHCLPCHETFSGCKVCHQNRFFLHEGQTIAHIPQPFPCLTCHGPGSPIPQVIIDFTRHPFMVEAECLNCHVY